MKRAAASLTMVCLGEDLHLQDGAHAGRTKKGSGPAAAPPSINWPGAQLSATTRKRRVSSAAAGVLQPGVPTTAAVDQGPPGAGALSTR